MKTPGVPESCTGERRSGTPARRNVRFGLSLLASLLLHALVLMLQFGAPDLGLPWSGLSGSARRTDGPVLQAILREPVTIIASAKLTPQARPVVSAVRPATVADQTEVTLPPRVSPQPAAQPVVADAAIGAAPRQIPPQAAPKEDRFARVEEEAKPAPLPTPGVAVLSTDKESPWSTSVTQTASDDEAKQRDMRAAEERAKEEDRERQRVEELARIEAEHKQIEQAAATRVREDALERGRMEELARLEEEKRQAEQLAAARVREEVLERRRVEERARIDREKRIAEQAAAAKAREEALAKEIAARALARERREAAGREAGSEPAAGGGADLARRALAQARGGMPVPAAAPPDSNRQRGSLLGHDPRDIRLAFYGEGWRQKVERIGSLNYPKLSRNRFYDALVVTVSINSDGSLAAVRIDQGSGHRELDEAVRRIVEMSAPFAAFPPDLKRSYDVIDITRTWTFQDERARISGQ